jgi:20S proteasome alpha/beta subunit
MTIAIGFKSTNGIVLCADSLEQDGVTKRNVAKLFSYQVGDEWGIAIASAGDGDLADSFNENLVSNLGNSDFDEDRLMSKLRTAISEVRYSYPYDQFGMLIGIFGPSFPLSPKLYRVSGNHLGPVSRFQAIGIGAPLAEFICSQIHSPVLNVVESARLGIMAILRTKEHAEGCGGPTSIVSFTHGQTDWEIKPQGEIATIEAEFSEESFRAHLQEYWVVKNPVSSFQGGYKWVPERLVRWTKSAKLNSIP